ncbi:variant erythrocyte surface antigen-1 alpha subunit [Babesia bovis T2Bo]|uniref:Variant erythrocyte surface antigen-1, alpha subunit n=1 Tax=Babesia bovis TaxID=5865 RepID=A7AST6_BABBO|nr:variant erythrocyte surface antigen-1 alpha subunit [Babesia bovis T2Bo]EDO05997.1 variant erythrocyte surface antigen-1 alpha subunit [Babesia bovis T2Bo]|eukprot:XP_001609565.1 variant erythrocyte surface antigen-1, alpha subunit [Babesia bovis T2Bo]
MAPNSAFTPKASLTDAPTNLKEAIDWVLRVTGRDGRSNKDECICGLASAVTDLLQSVQLEYHGYEGDRKDGDSGDTSKGPPKGNVTNRLNELFSLVQGLGGTPVVRTYIDQLAQVLSALVGWSSITKCDNGGGGKCKGSSGNNNQHGKDGECQYLKDVTPNTPCTECKCMKWDDPNQSSNEGHHLGRRCKRCSGSGGSAHRCSCTGGGGTQCTAEKCQCAKEGKCCKCCCNGGCGKCKKECSCYKEGKHFGHDEYHKDSYMSAYPSGTLYTRDSFVESKQVDVKPYWKDLIDIPPGDNSYDTTASDRRHQCARILLGSVCLIWSGITYMYWTGKYHSSSPRWNNHILDGSGLDDGTLSQWLQALGFPKDMLNNHGPGNRWDAIIWDGLRDKLYLGFPDTGNGDTGHGGDYNDNTFRNPAGMNYAGYIHTVDRGAFCSNATVFHKNDATITEENIHKCGALYKLYILSCAYFTGLQNKAPPKAENKTPRTIREILYWLSALPYSQAYPKILKHGKDRLTEVLKKPGDTASTNEQKQLSFLQTGRNHPITVHEFNLFAHFQAVTQYCPLVLIGIQGGIHSTDRTMEPAIHSLYANTECHFTYPTVSIQAYNQVVHYIRALFYQLYFLRKQCAVKVTCGGKWRECRYGKDVVSKGVISWMCLGCDPMEHDRKKRVGKVKGVLETVLKGKSGELTGALKDLLEKIGEVVVQLGNAQEALEGKKPEGIKGVQAALGTAKEALEGAVKKVNSGLTGKLETAKAKLVELTMNSGSGGILGDVVGASGLGMVTSKGEYDPGKNKISAAIHKVEEVLKLCKEWTEKEKVKESLECLQDDIFTSSDIIDAVHEVEKEHTALLSAINDLISICNTAQCPGCKDHAKKCGQKGTATMCTQCGNMTTTGVPSPLQAFLEDRLPGFSCQNVVDQDENPEYPPAASHLGHCNGSGQCCPLPMGFRGQFQKDGIRDCTGKRLYGILYFFSNENMMQSCVYTLVRVTAALSATTPQVLGDVFGFFRGGIGNPVEDKEKKTNNKCEHTEDPKTSTSNDKYFCGWCASGLRDEVKKIEWIYNGSENGGEYMKTVGKALRDIKGDKDTSSAVALSTAPTTPSNLSALTKNSEYLSPLTGELYTAVSATFGGTYLSWVLYLSDALEGGLQSLSDAFRNIECRGCRECDPNKCKKGEHGQGSGQCGCQSIVSCTGVLPVLYRHGFSYGNPFNLEGFQQKDEKSGDYSIEKTKNGEKHCHQFLDSLQKVIEITEKGRQDQHPLTNLLSQVGKLQYDIRLPWIFVLTVAWLVAVLYLAFGAIWPLDWTHMRSHWLRGGAHQWQCMWYKVMTGRKGVELVEYFGRR